VSPDYRVYRLDAGIHPRFAHHLLRSQPYRDQYKLYTRADTTFDRRVSKVDFHSMPLIVPPITEQRRIANFLDTEISRIDALLTARTRQLDILEQRRSIFERTAIAGGFSATAIDSGVPWIGKVDQQVTLVPLQRIVTLQRGVDLTEEQRRPGAVPVVTTAGVSGFHSHSIAPGPGVVVGRYGSAGSVHWVERDFWPHNTTLYVKNFNGNLPKYCFYVLRNLPYEMEQARSAIPGINRNDIHKRIMPLAPLKDQEHIASCIDSYTARTDAATAAINEGIALLTERRQALITAAVTGQIDVTTARGVSESEGVAV
jgi:type I restriction enzyme S subunit